MVCNGIEIFPKKNSDYDYTISKRRRILPTLFSFSFFFLCQNVIYFTPYVQNDFIFIWRDYLFFRALFYLERTPSYIYIYFSNSNIVN